MNALAPVERMIAFPPAMSAITADALTRIPTAHFRGMPWATDSIAACASMLADAARGDRTPVTQWICNAQADSDIRPLVSVLSAVCDSVVEQAFRARADAAAVSAFVVDIERDVLARLAAHQRRAQNSELPADLATSLVRLVGLHAPEAAQHLEATGVLARRLASALRLPAERITCTELAARLHDIGNVGVRRDVLSKPGRLTDAERREVQQHVEYGTRTLEDTPQLAFLAPIVRAHHERVDGNGYPDGLRRDAIPLEARIIAVASAFTALTAERPHRCASAPSAALRTIGRLAGRHFDVDVVDAAFELLGYTRTMRDAIA